MVSKSNRKGFTLIEFLAIVVILSVVFSMGYVVYFNIIKKSKDSSSDIALNNIKNAAEQYSKEKNNSIDWFKVDDENKAYACVTISDLVNFGYFKKNFLDNDLYKDLSLNSYFYIIKDLTNSTISEVSRVKDSSVDSDSKCQVSVVNTVNNASFSIDFSFYTDTIVFKATDLEDVEYRCAIKKPNENWKAFLAIDGVCTAGGLKGYPSYQGNYGIRLCLADLPVESCTADTLSGDEKKKAQSYSNSLSNFKEPEISFDPSMDTEVAYREVSIVYNDEGIYNGEGYHYFKLDSNAILENESDLKLCNNNDLTRVTSSNCTTSVSGNILKDKIYMVNGGMITFKIKEDVLDNNHKVYAVIKDKTNNYLDTSKEIPRINTAAPSCDIVLTGTVGKNGYYKSDVNGRLDTGEKNGVTALEYGLDTREKSKNGKSTFLVNSNTNGITYYGYVKYSNGTESTCSKSVKVDKVLPTCTTIMKKGSASGGSYTNGDWYDGFVYTSATCSDGNSGCISNKTVTTTGKTTNVTNSSQSSWTVQANGTSYLIWKVEDKAGNIGTCSTITTRVDTLAPTCSYTVKKYADSKFATVKGDYTSGSWYSGYVKTTASCTDTNGSGCFTYLTVTGASNNVSDYKASSREIKAEGHSVIKWVSKDALGHTKKCTEVNINLDRQSPTCTAKKSHLNTTDGVTSKFTCSDKNGSLKVSGVKACTEQKTKLKADKSYTIKDNAGNQGTCSVKVTSYKQYRYLQTYSKARSCQKSCCGTYTEYATGYNGQCPSGYGNYRGSASGSYSGAGTCSRTVTRTCTDGGCCGYDHPCGKTYGSWGGKNTGCGSQSRNLYK